MSKKPIVYGGGGGGKKVHTTPNNLFSDDKAELLIAIGEGPIEGLEDGEKSFYFDDTPLMSSDGAKNYTDYTLEILKGNTVPEEKVRYTLGGSSRQNTVNLELKQNQPITRITQSGDIDYIDVRIMVAALYRSTDGGSTYNESVSFQIEVKAQNESVWQNKVFTITGKTSSGYAKDYRIAVERNKDYLYEVRVTKLSPDSPETSNSGSFTTIQWALFEEVIADEGSFPNTALAHVTVKTTDQLNSLPNVSGVYKLLKVKIPSNYNPNTKTYSGEWDGTFKVAWTDNPAWCLYDLIMNDRYGVNAFYPVECDKWDFYEAGKYCDEKVPDGFGGMEARYTLNLVLTESKPGPEMINYIAGTFNATIYEDGSGLVRLAFQHDQQATHIFTKENVTPAGFVYNFSDPSTRYNEINVSFMNEKQGWISDTRRVANDENISLWGRIVEEYVAVGCIKESEAIRRARYRLLTNLTETMGVTFTTSYAGMNINLFDTILVADETMGYSTSGRLLELDEDGMHATLRDKVFLEAGVNYSMTVQSNSIPVTVGLVLREVGYVTDLYFTDPIYPDQIPEKAPFSLVGTSGTGMAKPFRVIGVTESENGQVSITGAEINRNKQIEADNNIVLSEDVYNQLPSYLDVPHIKDLNITQKYVPEYKQMYTIVEPVLDKEHYPYYADTFQVYTRLYGDEAWEQQEVKFGDTVIDLPAGDYEFIVIPETTLGPTPNFNTAPKFRTTIEDLTAPPKDVKNFVAEGTTSNIAFTWDKVEDYDLIGYQIREGGDWDTATIIADFITGTKFYFETDLVGERTFLIKAIDSLQNFSVNPAVAYAGLVEPQDVTEFLVTPNDDYLRFDWKAPPENNVEYEVRVGMAWDSAIKLFRVSGFNQTILNPAYTQAGTQGVGFLIRSVTKAGLYSHGYKYAEVKCELKQDRNIILDIDNAADNWSGITNGLATTIYQDVLSMTSGVLHAEHYFPVDLPEVTRARNWFETEGVKFGTRLTFNDLDYMWNSDKAALQNWLNSTTLTSSSGEIQTYITYELLTNYTHTYGFTFKDTYDSVGGNVTPTVATDGKFSPARFANGLAITRRVKLSYNLPEMEPQFTIKFKLRYTELDVNKAKVWRLSNPAGEYIECRLDVGKTLVVERSDGVKCSSVLDGFHDFDFFYFMIKQTSDKMTLDYLAEYASIKDKLSVDCAPLGKLTTLTIGGK